MPAPRLASFRSFLSTLTLSTPRTRAAAGAMLVAATALGGGAGPARADSPSGVFLAARAAEARGDIAASAHYMRRVAQFDRENDSQRRVAVFYSVLAGEMRAAMRMARPLLDGSDGRSQLSTRVALADAMRRSDYDAVIDLAETAGENLTTIERVLAQGWALYGLGQGDEARTILRAEDQPAIVKIVAAYHLGLLEALDGEDAAALAAFEEARASSSGWSRRLGLAAARVAERLGDQEKADAILGELEAAAPGDSIVRAAMLRRAAGEPLSLTVRSPEQGLAEIFYAHAIAAAAGSGGGGGEASRQRWVEDAREALFAARLSQHIAPDRDDAAVLVADLLAALWQYDEAAEVYASVPEDAITFESAQIGLASALAGDKRVDEAIDVMRKTITLPDARPRSFFLLGELLNSEEKYGECAEVYEAGIERLQPVTERDWGRLFELGVCQAQNGLWESAERSFDKALALNPGQPDVLNYLGYSLVEKGMRIDEARAMIEEAVAARPKAGFIVDSLGWVLYRIGDYEGAVRELERAVELSPAEAVINDHYGDALWMVGRKMEARFQWKRALSFEPTPDLDVDRIKRKLEHGLDRVLEEEESSVSPKAASAGDTIDASAPKAGEDPNGSNGG